MLKQKQIKELEDNPNSEKLYKTLKSRTNQDGAKTLLPDPNILN